MVVQEEEKQKKKDEFIWAQTKSEFMSLLRSFVQFGVGGWSREELYAKESLSYFPSSTQKSPAGAVVE